jgi:hypothetical protein
MTSSRLVYMPVDSTTMDTPRSFQDLDFFIIDDDGVFGGLDVLVKTAEHGIIFQKMSERFGVGDVVDREKLDLRVIHGSSKQVSSDPAEAIDTDFNGHD